MGLVADKDLERGIDLIIAAGRPLVALDQHGAGALFHHHQGAHEGRGRLGRGDEQQMDRPLGGRACGDADHRAVAHQRGIERDRGVACRRELAEMGSERRIAIGQRVGERADRKPRLEACNVGQFGHESAIDKHQPARFDVSEQGAGRLGPRLGGGIGRRGERLGIAH